ncbi:MULTISPECIES: hypothetical protein [Halolamina]|uniref:DUF8135 domain-containing protein n=1 Tax=Halolamina pelagica TaxID=699431 RepID=A0A1I5SYD9_9EURY|nr:MULTISPECIES: hypothetical protein [Halolamina]NHX36896.1 hypothetical protein [Halolamina sp. R1-12]SFP75236.1 hypothetical protein SAMN05216277_10752 [Halolamina pelagica]
MGEDREANGEGVPEEYAGADREAHDTAEDNDTSEYEGADDAEGDVPLSALRERIEAEREAAADTDADPFAGVDEGEPVSEAEATELFEEVEVGDIDAEAVWDAVVEGDAEVTDLLGEEPGVEPTVEPTGTPDEHVVDKREYCQRCEFFAEPPAATCTNEGTEIVELVDDGHFRVRGCPKVAADDEALPGFVSEE